MIEEILFSEKFGPKEFIKQKIEEIYASVGKEKAISALSGGVDSSVVTILGHRALGKRLETYFIDNGLMRESEPQNIVSMFASLKVPVKIIDAQNEFFNALKGITAPEEKREVITRTFYKDVFSRLVKERGAKYLLQGTNYTDIEETIAGIKRQHNVLEQLGIDTNKYGYRVIEPLTQLRKPAIRKVAKALGLPKAIYARPPFPGPALATRVIGEITREKIDLVRKATQIVEKELYKTHAFQYLAILHEDKVSGIKKGKRNFGYQVEIRCWESQDAKTATPTQLPWDVLNKLAEKITTEIPEVVSITYNITPKPPSCIEAI